MSGFGELYGELGHTHLHWPHTSNTTPGGIGSDQSCPLPSLSRIKKKYSICKVSWKALFPFFWCQIQTLTSKCSKILIYSQNISFFPHPVSPICFNFHRCNSFKRKKSQLTVISLLAELKLLFPFLWVFFQLCVVKHKKVIWEGTFRNPGITSFDQFVHDFEKMS